MAYIILLVWQVLDVWKVVYFTRFSPLADSVNSVTQHNVTADNTVPMRVIAVFLPLSGLKILRNIIRILHHFEYRH